MSKELFLKLVAYLCLTINGLTVKDLQQLLRVEQGQIERALIVLGGLTTSYAGQYLICSNHFNEFFFKVFINSKEKVQKFRNEIFKHFEGQSLSLKNIIEQTMNQFNSKNYFLLKQTISVIPNFILLYNHDTKFLLFQFW